MIYGVEFKVHSVSDKIRCRVVECDQIILAINNDFFKLIKSENTGVLHCRKDQKCRLYDF